MSTKNQLAATGLSNYNVTITKEAIAERDNLLVNAGLVVSITSPEDQAEAVALAQRLKAWSSQVEKSREEIKAPLLAAGRLLDQTAKDAKAAVDAEVKRLQSLLADFLAVQEAKRQAALREQEEQARKQREEQERKEREERERLAEIERQRLAAEQAAQNAKTAKARAAAAAQAARLEEEKIAAELAQEMTEPAPAPAPVAVPTVVKPQGAQVKGVIKYEVTDIQALYKAFPQCVELVERKQQINFLLNTPGLDLKSVPGLRAWRETSVAVRASAAKPEQLTY